MAGENLSTWPRSPPQAFARANAGDEKIDIQLPVERRDSQSYPHHLSGMLDQSAASSVVIIARRSCAAKAIAPFVQKSVAQRAEPRIDNRLHRLGEKFPIVRLFFAQIRGAFEQRLLLLLGERTHGPFLRFESILRMVKLTRKFDEVFGRQLAAHFVSRMIAPDAQRYAIAGVCEI